MMRALLAVLLTVCVLFVAGCQNGRPSPAIAAEVATKKAVEPWVAYYRANHPDEQQRVDDLMLSWQVRVDAEKALAR